MTEQEMIKEALKLVRRASLAIDASQHAVAAECLKQAFATISNLPKKEINKCE